MATQAKASSNRTVSRYPAVNGFSTTADTIAGWLSVAVPLVLISSALIIWWFSLPAINPDQFTDFGIVGAAPWSFYAAFILIQISFAFVISREDTRPATLLMHVVILIVMLHGTLALVYEVPRYAWTYKHLGVVDYVQRFGMLDTTIDAYQNWPGFFTFMALVAEVTGIQSFLGLANWAQVFWNLLYVGGLRLIYKAFTNDNRLVWLGIWIFFLTSWVGQDYFAPQALGFFLHLVVIGTLLTWFQVQERPVAASGRWWSITNLYRTVVNRGSQTDVPRVRIRPYQRSGLAAIVILSFFVLAFSHQLTPFITLTTIALLIILRRCNRRDLFILMVILLLTLLAYMSITFIENAELAIFGSIGSLFSNVEGTLRDYSRSSAGRFLVSQVTRLTSLGVWILAFLGAIRRLRSGYWDLALGVVAVAPFMILAMQAYGGEVLFRVYFLSLPGMAFLVGALLYSGTSGGRSWITGGSVLVVTVILSASLIFTYYGNERINHMDQNEVDALQTLYQAAPTGSLILTGGTNSPTRFDRYTSFWHFPLNRIEGFWAGEQWQYQDMDFDDYDLQLLYDTMADEKYTDAYLVISNAQKRFVSAYNLDQKDYLDRLEAALQQSPLFDAQTINADVTIYTLADGKDGGSP